MTLTCRAMTAALILAATGAAAQDLVFTGGVGPLVLPAGGVNASVMQDNGRDARIALAMNGESALRFAAFTSLSLGETVTMSICDHEILRATMQVQIDLGYVMSAPFDPALAQELADVINGAGSCAD